MLVTVFLFWLECLHLKPEKVGTSVFFILKNKIDGIEEWLGEDKKSSKF
jgi:hypothetical protein